MLHVILSWCYVAAIILYTINYTHNNTSTWAVVIVNLTMAGHPIGRGDNPLNKYKQRNETQDDTRSDLVRSGVVPVMFQCKIADAHHKELEAEVLSEEYEFNLFDVIIDDFELLEECPVTTHVFDRRIIPVEDSSVAGNDVSVIDDSSYLKYDLLGSRNMRLKERMKNVRSGNEKNKELNGALKPQNATRDGSLVVLEPAVPKPLPQPQLQAMKDASYKVVGGILVLQNPMDNNQRKRRPRKCGVCGKSGCPGTGARKYCPISISKECKRQKVRSKVYTRQCSVCSMYGPSWLNCGRGSGNKTLCRNFYLNGDRKQL
jgi:hypothetical protein